VDGVEQVCGRDRDQDAEADPVAEEGAADRLADDGGADERDENERHEGTLVLSAHDALLDPREMLGGGPTNRVNTTVFGRTRRAQEIAESRPPGLEHH
jgi:hypothetical protein